MTTVDLSWKLRLRGAIALIEPLLETPSDFEPEWEMRKQLGIREQQIEAMEFAYKLLHNLLTDADADFTLAVRGEIRTAVDKLYNTLNGVAD